MKIGFFSPLPPARTGVADYSQSLLQELRRHADVRLNDEQCEARLYHIGNNAYHREIYQAAMRNPGVVVLHDASLHHFLLGWMTREQYLDEFVYNYGEWSRHLGEELWQNRARSAADPQYFEQGMLRRVAETAQAVIVHNPGAADRVRAHAPAAVVVEIPHLFQAPALPDAATIAATRQALGVRAGTTLFGVFGHLRESKRLHSVLRAFREVQKEADATLLLAGEFVSTDLERALQPAFHEAGVLRLGYTPEPEFWRLACAVDACVNLRYPGAGETSGIAVRLMGAGKPVMVTTGPETSRLPQIACLRVDAGEAETGMAAAWMRWLCLQPEAGREIGRRAAAYIAAHHAPEAVVKQYLTVLDGTRCCPASSIIV